ncbi:MAG: amino acid transporter [Planctomycetes bacterium]|nr:amino acid transporter [Planctomycetota bacterium]
MNSPQVGAEKPLAEIPAPEASTAAPPVDARLVTPSTSVIQPPAHQSFWLWVMCLTGVDYFSTLAYQPSIAFDAVGMLAPLATIVLVALTLFGALPVFRRISEKSPHGQGSVALTERILGGWTSKFVVLVLLGFAATDFVLTQTLSAADAAEHLIHNPYWEDAPALLQHQMFVTMALLVLLGGLFLRGFREVIAVAVTIVTVYLALNLIVILSGLTYLATHPSMLTAWYENVITGNWYLEHAPIAGRDAFSIAIICLVLFPKLALGLSGFETGIAVMPLVRGDADDRERKPLGRIRGTKKLLTTAAVTMSFFLLTSSLVTTTLIRPADLQEGGAAANRALAYLAHGESAAKINPMFGTAFGTIYDASTVAILWFAGASAMSALLNLVPRYLPRYGMAPRWAEAIRILVLVFTGINLFVSWFFDASVESQAGAYATGVLVLICNNCFVVTIIDWRRRRGPWHRRLSWRYLVISLIFLYTTIAVIVEKPEGMKIAGAFIVSVIVFSMISRTRRSTELRFEKFEFVDDHSRFLWDALRHLEFPVLVPHRPGHHTIIEKDERIRRVHRLGAKTPIVFVEATVGDPSEFHHNPVIEVTEEEERFVLKLTRCASVAHAIATVALELSKTGKPPEIHFGWSGESPLAANLSFLLFGEGNVPWLVRELILKAEPDSKKQPRVIIG